MNRRRFLELLGTAALGSGIVYSFPSVIVPKNIASIGLSTCNSSGEINEIIIRDVFPVLRDYFFMKSPLLSRMRGTFITHKPCIVLK